MKIKNEENQILGKFKRDLIGKGNILIRKQKSISTDLIFMMDQIKIVM